MDGETETHVLGADPVSGFDPVEGADPVARAAPSRLRVGTHSGWLLAVCCLAQFMVILDLSIVNVALPHIQSALGFSAPDLLWVVDAYMIMFAGFLILGGRAADFFGQRRVFVVSLVLFGLASLAGGLAQDQAMLIGARAAQGFAGAFMAACSLAIITSSFPPGPQLHRAVGLWAAMNGAGGAAGVLLGGVITEAFTWRWVLLINPPIAFAAAFVAYRVVRERRRREAAGSFDLAGALTLTLGQLVLVYGVVEAGLAGWSAASAIGPIVVGLALLSIFTVVETRFASAPLIPIKELTKPLKVANTVVLLFSTALFPMWFLSTLYLQQVLGLSPLHAGLIFLPMTLTIFFVASRAGKLVSQFGVRAVLGSGLLMMTAGLLLFTRISPSGSAIVYVMIPGLLTAAGIAMSIVPSTIAATQGAKEGQAGLASGLVNTSRQVGGGIGLALLITLATQYSTHQIGAGHGVLHSLTDGFRLAYLIAAGFAAAAALVTFTRIPGTGSGVAQGDEVPGARRRWRARHVRRDRHRLRRLARRADRRVHDEGRIQVRLGALPASAEARDRGHAGERPARAGLHLRHELLRPQRSTDGRPERPADPRQPPAAGLVPAGAGKGRRRQPQPADLRRQARALLVAGRGDEHRRHRKRRRRGGQPALPDDRAAPRQGRLEAHAARDDHRRPRRLGDREQGHPDQPLELRRRLQRRHDRRRGAGVRPAHRQAAAQLGRAQARPPRRVARDGADERLPLGRLPRQLDRPRARRQAARLDAQHLGGLSREHRKRADRMDARRQALELQVRSRARNSSGSTTCAWDRARR